MSGPSNRRFRAIEPLIFFLSLLIDGALAGALYALIALAFVLVYKSSRMVNFALGEWIMTGATLAAVGQNAIGLGGTGALVFAGIPRGLQLPVLLEPLIVHGVPIPPEKLIAAVVAAIIIALVTG